MQMNFRENNAELTMLDELFLAFQINFHHHKYIHDYKCSH